jgi:cysteinyl-tRNA synthetase
MADIGCLSPTMEPKATDFIPEMIATIEKIVANGHAYAVGGDVSVAWCATAARFRCLHRGWV